MGELGSREYEGDWPFRRVLATASIAHERMALLRLKLLYGDDTTDPSNRNSPFIRVDIAIKLPSLDLQKL